MSNKHLFRYMEAKGYDFTFVGGCSEPGYDARPVILANWNNIPNKLFRMLESHGFLCEWEDEWLTCDTCYKVFRCSPDSYSWQMYGYIGDGFAVCGDCIDWDEFLESLENKSRKALTSSMLYTHREELESRYERVNGGFENGFHPGQNDNPESILKNALKNDPNGRYIFVMDSQGQFDIEFSLWKRLESPE